MKALKESETNQWVSEARFLQITVSLRFVYHMEQRFLGHKSLKLPGIMLAYNQRLLFSLFIVCSGGSRV